MSKSKPHEAALAEKMEDVLLNSDAEEQQSLLRVIEKLCGEEERQRVEFWAISEKKEQP